MLRKRSIALVALVSAAAASSYPAPAQQRGDAERGQALAQRICIACHGVRQGEQSVNPMAPPFAQIAESRGVSAIALNVALMSPHRAMPNLVLEASERADVVAYILSLKAP